MMNFLSKFLVGETDKSESEVTDSIVDVAKTQDSQETEVVAAGLIPDNTLSESEMPARPMYDASQSAGAQFSNVSELEEFEAIVGEALLPDSKVADKNSLVEAMRTVYDPEIPVNIYDLGLIYDTRIGKDGTVDIEMSLTAPGCPVAGEMPGMVADAVTQVDGTGVVTVRLVWEPQWTMDRMSEDAKLALGII